MMAFRHMALVTAFSTLFVSGTIGQESDSETGEVVLRAIDADTLQPIPNVKFCKENLLGEIYATSVGRSNDDGTLSFRSKPLPGYFFSLFSVPEGYKVTGLDEVPAGIRVGERVVHRFYLRRPGADDQFPEKLKDPPPSERRFLIPPEAQAQDGFTFSVDDMPGFNGQEVRFAFRRRYAGLAERVFRNGKRVRAALTDELRYFRKAEGAKAGDISEVSQVIIDIGSKREWTLNCRTKNGIRLKQKGFRVRFDELDSWDLQVPSFLHPEF